VATIEWLRLWPNEGFFPQIAQTLDTAAESSQRRSLVDADHKGRAGFAGAAD
jgi:hypothetical protein